MLRAAKMLAFLLTLNTLWLVRGETECSNDQDCLSNQFCYEVSSLCVTFYDCEFQNRAEGPEPARQPVQCGDCLPGYGAERLLTGEYEQLCKEIKSLKESEKAPVNDDSWNGLYIGLGVLGFVGIVLGITVAVLKMKKCTIFEVSAEFFEKVNFLPPRPTAPPQEDALNHLRSRPLPDEEQPPVYSSVINVAKDHLVNTTPYATPEWVNKPAYEPADHNHNVADGVENPVHNSSVNLQMELYEEEETIPSPWTSGQLTVDLPARHFSQFANSEQHDNVLNNVLMRRNSSSNSHDGDGSNDGSEGPEEASEPRMHGGNYCGPNVQINQTITLNIAQNGMR